MRPKQGGFSSPRDKAIFAAALLLILSVAGALRLSGLSWGKNLRRLPVSFSFHPDERTFVREVKGFDQKSPTQKGYVRGWTTQGFVLVKAANHWLGVDSVNVVTMLRRLSFVYGLSTILLVVLTGIFLFHDWEAGLWAGAFLGLTGLHTINSHFGTADSAATFFYLATIFFTVLYVRKPTDWQFLGVCAAFGASLAVKFQLSLLPIVLLVLWRGPRKPWQFVQGAAFILVSFYTLSYFNYTPWEFRDFIRHLQHDNVRAVWNSGRHYTNWFYVLQGLIPAMGFPLLALFMSSAVATGIRGYRWIAGRNIHRILESPWTYFLVPSSLQYYMIAAMDARGMRHALVIMPGICLLTAMGWVQLRRNFSHYWWARLSFILLAAGMIAYQIIYIRSIESLFMADPRVAASNWLSANIKPGESVTAYSGYSKIPGNYTLVEKPADFIVTSNQEYNTYLGRSAPPKTMFDDAGGLSRLQFWNQLFKGELAYDRVQEFNLQIKTPELLFNAKRKWPEIGLYLPMKVVIFHKRASETGASTP